MRILVKSKQLEKSVRADSGRPANVRMNIHCLAVHPAHGTTRLSPTHSRLRAVKSARAVLNMTCTSRIKVFDRSPANL